MDVDLSLGTFCEFFFIFLDTSDDIAEYLNLTRYGVATERELYGTEDERAEGERYPQTLFACDDMEVEGNVEGDGEVDVSMFETGEVVVVGGVGRAEEGTRCEDEVGSGEEEDGGVTGEGGEGNSDDQIGGAKENGSDDDKSNESTREDESEDDGEVTRPQHRICNSNDSNEEELVDLLNGVDGEAPMDDESPCKFSAVHFLEHFCVRLGCLLTVFVFAFFVSKPLTEP